MVKIQLISKEPKLEFLMSGINFTVANAFRRIAEEIPVLAIDIVEFIKNDSALNDEILAHRLGLVPLKTDKSLVLSEECSCKDKTKGCAQCMTSLSLKIVGPCMVYAKDLTSKGVKVVYPDLPIVLLQKGQELELIAEARLGKGKQHAKFAPGLIYYRAYPIIDFKECDNKEDCINCVEACPKKLLSIDEKTGKIIIKDEDIIKCDLCGACAKACEQKEKKPISLKASEEDFIFTIEGWGQLSNREIFIKTIETLNKDLKLLAKEVSKIK